MGFTRSSVTKASVAALALLAAGACGGGGDSAPTSGGSAAPVAATTAPPTPPDEGLEPAPEATPLPNGLASLRKPFKGDLDGMVKRRVIRVLTVQNPHPLLRGPRPRGRDHLRVDQGLREAAEQEARQQARHGARRSPSRCARDQLIPRLLAGEGDIAAAALTVTAERKKKVDFSDPFATGVREVLVSGPARPAVASIDDLSGKEVYVRPSSSYAEHIGILNKRLAKDGKAAGDDPARPGGPRGRRHPRDGGRRARSRHGGGRLHGRPVRAGVSRSCARTPTVDEPARSTSPGPSARAARSWRRR